MSNRLLAYFVAVALAFSTSSANAIVFKLTSVPVGSSTNCTDNGDGESDHSCVIKVFVISLNGNSQYVCQTYLDYETYHTVSTNKKVKWKLKVAQAGDKHSYAFDVANGIAPVDPTETDDFLEKAVDDPKKPDKFHWNMKDHGQTTHTPKHYQMTVVRDDGMPCAPQDPIIVNEG